MNKKNKKLEEDKKFEKDKKLEKNINKFLIWFLGIVILITILSSIISGDNFGGAGSQVSCRLTYQNSSFCNYVCTKEDKSIRTTRNNPGTCPGFPKYFKWAD